MMNRNKAAEPGGVVIHILAAGCHEFKHHEILLSIAIRYMENRVETRTQPVLQAPRDGKWVRGDHSECNQSDEVQTTSLEIHIISNI